MAPLRQLVTIALGPAAVLARGLADVPGIEAAFVFGSWARRALGEAGPPRRRRPPRDRRSLRDTRWPARSRCRRRARARRQPDRRQHRRLGGAAHTVPRRGRGIAARPIDDRVLPRPSGPHRRAAHPMPGQLRRGAPTRRPRGRARHGPSARRLRRVRHPLRHPCSAFQALPVTQRASRSKPRTCAQPAYSPSRRARCATRRTGRYGLAALGGLGASTMPSTSFSTRSEQCVTRALETTMRSHRRPGPGGDRSIATVERLVGGSSTSSSRPDIAITNHGAILSGIGTPSWRAEGTRTPPRLPSPVPAVA